MEKLEITKRKNNYTCVTLEDIQTLKSFISADRIFTQSEINDDYSHDELGDVFSLPDILIKVNHTKEVAAIMKYANDKRIPVVIRGSGTGLVGACVAISHGIMIDTTLMNNIIDFDPNTMTITVEPGVLLMDLAQYIEDKNYLYPPDPGEKSATIGGNISTNAGGMRAVKYGVTRDYVLGLTVVLTDGSIMELGGKVAKNSSGYSLKDLIIGSEGTLAVITRAILRIIPLPAYRTSLLIPFPDIELALKTVPLIINAQVSPTAIEFMERQVVLYAEDFLGKKFPNNTAPAYLLLTFDGSCPETVNKEYQTIAELCIGEGAFDAYIVDTEERHKSVWSARGAFLEGIKASTTQMDECDVVVPRDKTADFILFSHKLAKELAIRIPSFGHAGDGNLHLYICRDNLDDTNWHKTLNLAFQRMYQKAEELRGQVSGEHGIGYAKKEYLKQQLGEKQINLMQGIKSAFDPNNILNPGKIFEM